MAKESIDQLARRLAESLPQGVKAVRSDMEKNFRSILGAGLARLDLVTREEFEVQEAVLARTRAKLETLTTRLDELEAAGATTKSAAAAKKPAAKKKPAKTAKAKAKKKTAKKTAGSTAKKTSAKKPASKKKKTATRKTS